MCPTVQPALAAGSSIGLIDELMGKKSREERKKRGKMRTIGRRRRENKK
jgi:hypothetical protein